MSKWNGFCIRLTAHNTLAFVGNRIVARQRTGQAVDQKVIDSENQLTGNALMALCDNPDHEIFA